MAILNGTEVKLYTVSNSGVGAGNLVAFAQNCSISIEHSPRDITNKESGGYSESLEGLRSWSIEMDGAYAYTDAAGTALTNGADALIEDNVLNLRQKFFVGFGGTTTVTSDVRYWGECYITSWSVSAGTEDTSTMSISLTGTGVLTQNVV
tara:strand:- start:2325 stop:2774 length:450 start_codon:yes stop_codon:yes gene_type:complete